MAVPFFSRNAKYSPSDRHGYRGFGCLPSAMLGHADDTSPVISLVIPWVIFEIACGPRRTVNSEWPSMSMNPGATTCPPASITRLAVNPGTDGPTYAIRSPTVPTLPRYHGLPVP